MIVMSKFKYREQGIIKEIQSHMVCTGKDDIQTGMSMTVGLPLGSGRTDADGCNAGKRCPHPYQAGYLSPLLRGLKSMDPFTEQEKVLSPKRHYMRLINFSTAISQLYSPSSISKGKAWTFLSLSPSPAYHY